LAAIHTDGYTKEENARIYTLGSNALKDWTVTAIGIKEPGPGYWHWPMLENGEPTRGYDVEWFKQLCNEKRIQTFSREGYGTYKWTKLPHTHNEAFDLACYSLAALEILGGKKALENAHNALHAPKKPAEPSPFGAYRPEPETKRPPMHPSQKKMEQYIPGMNKSPFGRAR
jgi:phage terminase large subunit GpA-like protein